MKQRIDYVEGLITAFITDLFGFMQSDTRTEGVNGKTIQLTLKKNTDISSFELAKAIYSIHKLSNRFAKEQKVDDK